jgi:anti-sigma-K factor RskA
MTPTPGSGGGVVRSHEAWRELAAAYSIDALDAGERAEFEAHLATCAECRALVTSFGPVATGLGLAGEAEAPPLALRAKTLARATAQSQPGRSTVSAPLPFARATKAPRAPSSAPAWWLVAASVAAAVGLGIYSMALRQQLGVLRTLVASASAEVQTVRAELASVRRDSTRLSTQVSVLSAADIHRVDLAGQARASLAVARAYVSPTRGLMFSAEHLPTLAAGHVYQVWVLAKTAKAPISAGVLTPASDGTAAATMPMPNDVTLASITAVAVTEEPTPQGSASPTMPILLVGSVGK